LAGSCPRPTSPLGLGSDAGRERGARFAAAIPSIPAMARKNRYFMHRVVRYLAGQGVRQFLDIGTGFPTSPNVHEIAQGVAADSRVVM
jgi:hypothetical protein